MFQFLSKILIVSLVLGIGVGLYASSQKSEGNKGGIVFEHYEIKLNPNAFYISSPSKAEVLANGHYQKIENKDLKSYVSDIENLFSVLFTRKEDVYDFQHKNPPITEYGVFTKNGKKVFEYGMGMDPSQMWVNGEVVYCTPEFNESIQFIQELLGKS